VVEYRTFHNCDPPEILKLWHASGLGPSAAEGFPCDILELFVFSQPFFEKKGFFVAVQDKRIVAFAHGGFPANEQQTSLQKSRGNIAALVVHPDFRRQGIGSELVRHVEKYLSERGSTHATAGPGLDANGFYNGIYGGLQASGFSRTVAPWPEFFDKLGYVVGPTTQVMHRDLKMGRDPISARLLRHRRRLDLVITDRVGDLPWWWHVRFGQMDALRFQLKQRHDESIVAVGQIVGLDVYIPKWGVRAVGMRDVEVPESERRRGYGLSLVLEVTRRLREQSIELIEVQIDGRNQAAVELFTQAGFEPVQELLTFERVL